MIPEILETNIPDVYIKTLSRTEFELVENIIRLGDDRAIAEAMHIELSTVKCHLCNIYKKLGMSAGKGEMKIRSRAGAIELVKVYFRALQLKAGAR